jgi:two-component system sensor histidine kinase YesM
VIIPVSLVVSVLYKRLIYEITSQISRVVVNSLNFTSEYVESSLDAIKRTSSLLLREESIVTASNTKPPMNDREIIDTNITIRKLFYDYILRIRTSNSTFNFDSFCVYLPNNNLLMDSKTTYYEEVIPKNIDFLGQNPDEPVWFVTRGIDFYTLNGLENRYGGYNRLLTFTDEIRDENNLPTLILAANVRIDFLGDYYRRVQRGISGDFMIIDRKGNFIVNNNTQHTWENGNNSRLLSSIMNSQRFSGNFQISVDNRNYLAVFSRSAYSMWNYVVLIPDVEIFGQFYNIQKFFVLIIIIITLLIIPICFLISRTLYKPLEKLILAMQNVKNGNLDTAISDARRDEYQKVYEGFNLMLGELKKLIEDLSNEKSLNKQAEINLIQAQINPHFLYNTLDSIYSIAVIRKVDEIANMATALSKFFRVSLSGGKTDTSLKEALDIVKSYLTIQNIRFNNKIQYEISIPEQYMKIIVPKLLLQPIVENSIYHGLEKKKGKGRLTISSSDDKGNFCLYIDDNGTGIPMEQLAVLEKTIRGEEDDGHFALKTLNKQIKLKYGKNYGLSIESQYGKWTRVTISLPLSVTG